MRDQHGVNSQEPGGAAERLERAATLLLATSALAGVALVGWGGLIIDLRPLGTIGGLLWHAVTGGEAIWPALGGTVAWTSWEALAPVVGTVISVLFWLQGQGPVVRTTTTTTATTSSTTTTSTTTTTVGG